MTDWETSPLYGILHPSSVAFWGASGNPMGMGSVQLSQLRDLGFEGAIYPIHPKEKDVCGLKAYQKVSEVPDTVDLAVLVIPTRIVPQVLEECGRAGIRRAIVVSAGFAEVGDEGRQLQDEIKKIARQHDITFLGPNCIGVVNPRFKLNTTFCRYEGGPGFIGMASQSGSFVTQMFTHLEGLGLGFSQAMSVGNEAQTDITDCIEYLGDCPDTKVIGLYIEAIRRGPRFLQVARAVSKKKPIVAHYVGGSEAGGKAAHSHTGALAGPDHLYNGIFSQAGVIRTSSIEELFDFCAVLGSQPLPAGNRIGILTHSGGPGAAAADAAARCGLNIVDFSPATVEGVREVVPHTASVGNPVDMTFSKNPQDYTGVIPRILLKDPKVDCLFVYLLLSLDRVLQTAEAQIGDSRAAEAVTRSFIKSQSSALATLTAESGKPVVGGTFTPRTEPFIRQLQEAGFPVLPSPERAVRALGALARYSAWRQSVKQADEKAPKERAEL